MHPIDRRHFLRGALSSAAGASLLPRLGAAPWLAALPPGPRAPFVQGRGTSHLVLVAFAGGVRTRETLGSPGNVPNLVAMAKEGVVYTRARTANLGHYGAALSIFTGISEARGIRENARGPDPTIFEYLRKDLNLDQGDVWITTSGGAQQVNYSYGTHADYGARYGANTLDGDGIFNKEFSDLLASFGTPAEWGAAEREHLAVLRRGLGGMTGDSKASLAEADSLARVESYILNELTRGTSGLSGGGASDAKAIRLARNLLSVFRPRVIAVALQDADTAHGSFNGYVDVIRRNDAALGELLTAIQGDPELATSTAVVVVPEFGRDKDLNTRRGLDHGDGSDDLNYVSCIAWGPDFKKGKEVRDDVRVIDVAPTLCELLGADARHARGSRLPGLFA